MAVFTQSCDDALGPVLHALVRSAQLEGKEGHQDRKLYLGLLGIYEPGVIGGRGKEEDEKKPASTMTDAELIAHFADRPHLLPAGVQRRMGIDPDAAKDSPPIPPPPSPPSPPPPAEPARTRK